MPSATVFLLFGVLLATVLSLVAWLRLARRPRSPLTSVREFRGVLSILASTHERRRRSR